MRDPRWISTHEEDGEPRFRVGRDGDDLVAEWCGRAFLRASRDGERVEIVFADDVSPELRRKLESGAARLLVHQLRGELALHGAAVAFGERAIVLMGGSGLGKSTLAAALCRRGAALLADDAVALAPSGDGFVVLPTESLHWLDDDARAALDIEGELAVGPKRAVASPRAGTRAVPVAALIGLAWREDHGPTEPPALARAFGAAAFATILPNLVRLVVDDPELSRNELDRVHAIADRIPVFVLERPFAFERLPDAVDMLARLCNSPGEDT